MHHLDGRLEKLLRDKRRYKCAQDNYTHENGVLILVNDPVLQAIQRGNRSKGKARSHEQCGVARFLDLHVCNRASGKTPTIFVTIFRARNALITSNPVHSAGSETYNPALMK